jgi:hypothetical protein
MKKPIKICEEKTADRGVYFQGSTKEKDKYILLVRKEVPPEKGGNMWFYLIY